MKLLEKFRRIQIDKKRIYDLITLINVRWKLINQSLSSNYVLLKEKAEIAYELTYKKIISIRHKFIYCVSTARAYLKVLIKTPWSAKSIANSKEIYWKATNPHRKRFSIAYFERNLLFASEHPMRFAFSMIFLHFLVLLSVKLSLPYWSMPSDTWQAAEQLTHFSTIWMIQTTLVALVYPIVISFVAVYLQRRPVAEAMINLYLLDSGALVAGISSLLLVIVMGTQYLLIGTFAAYWLSVWAAADTAWFILNAILTTYFLFRTVEFLKPEIQAEVVKRYAINAALSREIHKLNTFIALDGNGSNSWFLVPSYIDKSTSEGPCLLISGYNFNDIDFKLEKNFTSASRILDIKVILIKLVVDFWYWKASDHYKKSSDGAKGKRFSRPTLTLNLHPGVYEGNATLATVSNGPPLNSLQEKLLKWSIKFEPISRARYSIQVGDILSELGADAINTLSKYDNQGFSRAWELLVQLHELLLVACLIEEMPGKFNSYAMLTPADELFTRSLHSKWIEKYRDIFQAGIDGMIQNNYPLKRMCNLLVRLKSDDLLNSPTDITDKLLQLPPLMMYQLSNWWAFRVEEQGIIEHSHRQMVVLRLPLNRVYEEALSAFVSGWETSRPYIPKSDRKVKVIWSELSEKAQLQVRHINETGRMLLSAIFRGDQAAAEWLADVLNKWWGNEDFNQEPPHLYKVKSLITIEDLNLSWEEFCLKYAIDINFPLPNMPSFLQAGVYRAAVKNYWLDIVLITIEVMISWVRTVPVATANASLAFEIATGLWRSKQWKGGGETLNVFNTMSAQEYFSAKVRRNVAPANKWGGGYSALIDNFIERIQEMQLPNMISSRIYSGRGNDIGELVESELLLLIILSDEPWNLNASLSSYLNIWFNDHLNLEKNILILRDHLDDLIRRFDYISTNASEHIGLFKVKIRDSETSTEILLENARKSLEDFRSILENKIIDAIASLPIDQRRLMEIARFASKSGFKKESGLFPIHLFNIEYTSQCLKTYVFNFNGLGRQEVTKMQIKPRSYSDSIFDDQLSSYAARVVLTETLNNMDIQGIDVQNAESYWTALKAQAKLITDMGDTPILLIQTSNQPEWLRDWLSPDFMPTYDRPTDMNVVKKTNMGNGYKCNFNDIEVFVAPLPDINSIVIAKEVFKDLTFTYFGGERERNVDAQVVAIIDSPSAIDLKLTFKLKVETVKRLTSKLVVNIQ